jgi:hypothetical protein
MRWPAPFISASWPKLLGVRAKFQKLAVSSRQAKGWSALGKGSAWSNRSGSDRYLDPGRSRRSASQWSKRPSSTERPLAIRSSSGLLAMRDSGATAEQGQSNWRAGQLGLGQPGTGASTARAAGWAGQPRCPSILCFFCLFFPLPIYLIVCVNGLQS